MSSITWSGTTMLRGDLAGLHAFGSKDFSILDGRGEWGQTSVDVHFVDMLAVPGLTAVIVDSGRDSHDLAGGGMRFSANGTGQEALLHGPTNTTSAAYQSERGTLRLPSVTEVSFRMALDPVAPTNEQPYTGPTFSLGNSLEIRKAQGHLELTGPLALAVWGYDLSIGDEAYWSGERTTSATPLDVLGVERRSQIIQAESTWSNTRIAVKGDNAALYLRDISLSSSVSIRLEAPRLPGAAGEILGNELVLAEAAELNVVEVTDSGIRIQVVKAGPASLDGHFVVIGPPDSGFGVSWTFSLFALAAILLGVAVARRTQPDWVLRRLRTHLHGREYQWVAAHAGPALRSRRTARQAGLYKAISLLALGEYKEAHLFLADLQATRRPDPATYHFLTAHAAGGLGQTDVAARELQACLELEPSFQKDAEAMSTLREALQLVARRMPRDLGEAYV